MLDIGCGGGRTMERLSSLSPGGKVMGIDVSPQSVAVARQTNREAIAQGRMDVKLGSVSALPFEDATFDLATAIETHYYWPDLVRDLAEVKRVLKPDGRVAIIAETYRGRRNDWLYRPVMRLLLRATYMTPQQHEDALRAAGYTDVRSFVEEREGWIAVTGAKPT
jgi:ubiquinone/menaquinone biosynthesis C-methylase UbiE